MATVFLAGRFIESDDARVSAFDAGFVHGVGLFETMLGGVGERGPWVFRLEDHLDRLIGSARDLGLSDSLRKPALAEAVLETIRRSGLARARARLTVTGGDMNLLSRPGAGAPSRVDPTVLIVAQPATEYPSPMFERGVSAVIADLRVNPLDAAAGHKTVNYWMRLRELQRAAAAGAGEAIVFQVSNHLAGGCVSNLFLVKAGRLLTPIARGEEAKGAIASPVLPGVTRGFIVEWAARRGIEVVRRMLAIDDLLGAGEAFLTNSSWGVLPVVKVEKEEIGDAEVGEVTVAAREAWEEGVEVASL